MINCGQFWSTAIETKKEREKKFMIDQQQQQPQQKKCFGSFSFRWKET